MKKYQMWIEFLKKVIGHAWSKGDSLLTINCLYLLRYLHGMYYGGIIIRPNIQLVVYGNYKTRFNPLPFSRAPQPHTKHLLTDTLGET